MEEKKLILSRQDKIKHLVTWVILTVFISIADPIDGSFIVQVIGTGLIMGSYIFVFYSQFLFVFPKFYRINNFKLFVIVLCVFIIHLAITFLVFSFVTKYFERGLSHEDWLFIEFILFSIISAVAFGSYQNKASMAKMHAQNEKEKLLLMKELGFFKNQFNSHITFNFLNYCYGHVRQSSKEATEAIESYSEMLRFTMNNKPDEVVPLEKEIAYINQFINLKKQLSKGLCVTFNTEGNMADKFILPRIFITFVENAFKHGDTHSMENPIAINITSSIQNIILEVKNKKQQQKQHIVSTGVGQQNVKNQLNLFYKNKHQLELSETQDSYYCKLSINT